MLAWANATGRPCYRSSSKTTVNNHYHGGTSVSGCNELGRVDYVIPDSTLSRDLRPGT